MSTEIRPITDDEIDSFALIAAGAYPGASLTPEELAERMRQGLAENPTTRLYGAFRDGQMLGGMRHHDFTMYFHGTPVPVGGVAMVAVDLLHKKEHVARDLIHFYLRHYREQGAPLAALWPFRPDFYRQMGFGYGAKLSHYRLRPDSFPRGARGHLRHLTPDDLPALLACYGRYARQTHGLFVRQVTAIMAPLLASGGRVLAYVDGGEVRGYMAYGFSRGANFITNDIVVRELVYEHPAALAEIMAFLHAQADQIANVVLDIQDDQLHQIVRDPRNGSGTLYPSVYHETNTQGLGIMYRVIDTPGLFAALPEHDFGGQSLTLEIELGDSFLPESAGETVVRFRDGRAELAPGAQPDVRLRVAVEHFSSLVMGATGVDALCRYGLAEIDDPNYSGRVRRLFDSPAQPVCLTAF
ncbi:GNAT family N-acetyltransferase [Oscillochloris sp. ZM17-4]|uniref:GNAT family N-acetyltransferase n=1 Tax=Oscillochloris sp. ZM17-4 TaxID=2866714 RepID=UPI001C73B393|nr:GNAT family N-acetyltransferase [Oscillochloris sp. ZM17-4]MBX0326295.1 GNAT family N-acetyltransferase [Oscillochloris sp. ZM17-4]